MTDEILTPDANSIGEDGAQASSAAAPAAIAVQSPVPATSDSAADPYEYGMADAYSGTFASMREGDVIKGYVVRVDREGVLVDVGLKSEGLIRRNELSRDMNTPVDEIVSVGDEISVYVLDTDTPDGNILLSKKRADFEKAWDKVAEARDQGATLTAVVTDRVKGGLTVDLGIRGFVPASHVGSGSVKTNLDKYVGQTISLKVIEVDKEKRKVVLSNKLALDEERQARKSETVNNLEAGQIRPGVVRRLTNYGAFVDLGGIDGLLHISEISWTRISHPQEVLKEGQDVEVVILKMDIEAGRVSLGMRQIQPDPWSDIASHYQVGDIIRGSVTRVLPFGAFVQVEGGIEGVIPNAELASRKSKQPAPAPGDEVEVKVIDLQPEARKLSLSLRQARTEVEEKKEREEVEEYKSREPERDEPRFTIGDAFRAQQDQPGEAASE